MSKAKMSTGNAVARRRFEHDRGMYAAPFDALAEARAILAETEPATAMVLAVRRPSTLTQHAAFGALAEALAAFVAA